MDPIKTFIRRPIFTAMLDAGGRRVRPLRLPAIGVDQFPNVDFPVVTITTVLPGADPETMENNVSDPIEEALNTLSGVDELRSMNLESVSQIIVQFTLDKNVDVAAQDVRDRVAGHPARAARRRRDARRREVRHRRVAHPARCRCRGSLPIERSPALAEDVVKPGAPAQAGRGRHRAVGGREREIQRRRWIRSGCAATALAISDVTQALRAQSMDIPVAAPPTRGAERVVRSRPRPAAWRSCAT